MLTPDVAAELEASVFQDEGSRKDLARASCKGPLSSAVGDLADWFAGQVNDLRRAKEKVCQQATAAGRLHPS
eukprot:5727098-Lingulodinium_polyedra.AAC.1